MDADQDLAFVPQEYSAEGVPPLTGQYRLSSFGPAVHGELLRGGVLVLRDVEREIPGSEGAAFAAVGVRAVICCCLKRDGVLRALMAVHQITPRNWTEAEVAIVSEVVERCWSMIEQRRAEAKLRQNEEGLRHAQKMEAVGQLAGGIAHDFNNLLSVILSYSSLIGDGIGEDPDLSLYVEEIKKAALRAGDMTRQLLTFSRQQMLQPRVIDLNRILSQFEKMLKRLVPEDVSTTLRPAESLGHVLADRSQVEQVIVNLVVNACDAMPKGGGLTITTRSEISDKGNFAVLTVQDTGAGMDATTVARIFEPFFTTKPRGKGTGLGLAMVYGFVTQSGGYVDVRSELGKGAAFDIFLPVVEAALDADDNLPVSASRALAGGTETVLVVEDVEQVRQIVRSILERAGYKVIDATDGADALKVASKFSDNIDLLVTDVVMPEMGGRELAERLQRARPNTKVLYMSGYTEDSIVDRGVLMRGIDFMAKPFTPDTLLQHVRGTLDKKKTTVPPVSATRILLVDDEEAILQLTERVLRKRGFQVTCNTSPLEALRVFAANPEAYDVIVTDVGMPELGGFDVAHRVRNTGVKVVITSGYFEERDRAKAQAAGIPSEAMVLKPDTIEELAVRIEAAIAALRTLH